MAEKIKYTDMIENEEVLKIIFANYPETIKY